MAIASLYWPTKNALIENVMITCVDLDSSMIYVLYLFYEKYSAFEFNQKKRKQQSNK